MSRSSPSKGLDWGEVAALGILGGMFAAGLVVNGPSVVDVLLTVAFTVVVLLAAWQGQRMTRQAWTKQVREGEALSERDAVSIRESEQERE